MSSTAPTAERSAATVPGGASSSRRWTALFFIGLAQLMVVLDATIVNIALPSAQHSLHISDGNRQWVITAYTLAFGGLLLFGGRVADLVGRKRTFLIGLIGFAGASALGGAAVNSGMLFGARALQGAFGALLAPSALSLLAVMFTQPKERAKAFGVYGAIAGSGAAIGLILGGVLTEYLSWRWALYVNVPIAVVAFLGASAFVHVAGGRNRTRLDVPGAVLVTGGLMALVYGFTRAESHGWHERGVLAMFVATGVLLVAFVVVEAVTRAPLLPLRVVAHRVRGGAYLTVGLAVIAMFGLFLFLTYYMQIVRGYSPMRSGLAFLPFSAGVVLSSTQIAARLMHRVPARVLMVPGLALAAAGMALLTQLQVDSSYVHLILPTELLLSVGLGCTMTPAMNIATTGVAPHEAGVASAMVNTAQQVGGSIGTSLLNTLAATATTAYIASHANGRPSPQVVTAGMVHGFTVGIWWALGFLGLALLVAIVLINHKVHGRHSSASRAEPSPAGIAIRGRVHSGAGAPVPGATVTLVDLRGQQLGRATSQADGSYALPVPGPGSYLLIAGGNGHQPEAATVVVGAEPTFVELVLPQMSRLTGVVRSATTGEPIPGATVAVADARGEIVGSAQADQSGEFAVQNLVTGGFTVVANAGGHRPQAMPIEIGHRGTTRCDVELRRGGDLRGTIRAGTGNRPLEDARVTLVNREGDVVAETKTGPDGGYAFTGLDSGEYTVVASAYRPAKATAKLDRSNDVGLDLTLNHPGA